MTGSLAKGLWLKAARAGFGAVWLGGVAVLAWTFVAGLAPVYQVMALT